MAKKPKKPVDLLASMRWRQSLFMANVRRDILVGLLEKAHMPVATVQMMQTIYMPSIYPPALGGAEGQPPTSDPTSSAEDLGPYKGSTPQPAAPSFYGGELNDLIDAYLQANNVTLGKTRRERMFKNLRAQIGEWFIEATDNYFPERTNHLISSYMETFRRALAIGEILIQSDVYYAAWVEALDDANWTKEGTKPHAARYADAELRANMPEFLQNALRFALT